MYTFLSSISTEKHDGAKNLKSFINSYLLLGNLLKLENFDLSI